jgi:hypothetical protein
MVFNVCQSKFWNINRECGGLKDEMRFYPKFFLYWMVTEKQSTNIIVVGNSTSACDGTTIKVEHHQ